MKTRLNRASLVVAAIGGLVVAGVAFADPLIPGKTRFGDVSPAAPVENGPAQAAAPAASGRVSVLVHMQAGADRGPVRGFAAAQGGHVKYEYDILPNVINLRGIPQGALNALAATPGVARWEPDREVHAHMNDSTPLIRALQSQIAAAGLSADGAGIRVCIIDSGIDSDSAMYSTRIDTAAGFDFVNNDNDPEDDAGHGSHVAGTAVGGENLNVDFGCVGLEPFHGIAPQATLIGIKVLGASGSGSFSDVIAGINYGADQSPSGARCDVINMSLGAGAFSGTCDGDSAAAAANNAVDAGVVVIASSGNDGFNNAMGTPACGSKVISVGLTFDDSYPSCEFPGQTSFFWCFNPPGCSSNCTDDTPAVDEISCQSNNSSALDVVAPGCITFSADKDNSPNGIVGFCGTSMSSPHVAGLAALLLSADGSLTPAEVRQHIRDGAIDLGAPGFDNVYGFGRIDAINSLSLLGPECVVPADCNDGVACTDDDCVDGSCVNTPNNANCPDDGLFCNGTEFCDAVLDCSSTGDPCTGGETCNEGTDTCDPPVCDNDGTCESGEDCNNCPNDCFTGSGVECGNGVCEAADGEDCVGCPADCDGKQNGNPNGRFCCGDGDGQGPIVCDAATPECNGGGFACTDVPAATSCCGDDTCEGTENDVNCAIDCGCTVPADCDDANECTVDDCVANVCQNTPVADGTSCNAGADLCCGGSCASVACNVNGDCDDGDACSTDTCLNGGTCSATCDNAFPACQNGDGCCPPGCTFTNDDDCPCGGQNAPCSVNGDCCSGNCKNNGKCSKP